jgi:hypothetical protein
VSVARAGKNLTKMTKRPETKYLQKLLTKVDKGAMMLATGLRCAADKALYHK